jgi:hypothetical protein
MVKQFYMNMKFFEEFYGISSEARNLFPGNRVSPHFARQNDNLIKPYSYEAFLL